jgi:hypothetical protein
MRCVALFHFRYGFKGAKGQIAAAKVLAPNAALRVIDAAIQVHGGAGVCQVKHFTETFIFVVVSARSLYS